MAKRPRPQPGKCVHCLNDPVERTWDHVFPRSWYPNTSDPSLHKWQVPSCLVCNGELGKIEKDFLLRMAFCLDPNHPAASGLYETALRSLDPSAGKNARDSKARAATRQKILQELREGDGIPDVGQFPGLGERWGRPREEQIAVPIPKKSIDRIAVKIVRGIFYVVDKKFIEPPYAIRVHVVNEKAGNSTRQMLDHYGTTFERPPGIVVRRAVAPEDEVSSFFEIELWQHFKVYATIQAA